MSPISENTVSKLRNFIRSIQGTWWKDGIHESAEKRANDPIPSIMRVAILNFGKPKMKDEKEKELMDLEIARWDVYRRAIKEGKPIPAGLMETRYRYVPAKERKKLAEMKRKEEGLPEKRDEDEDDD